MYLTCARSLGTLDLELVEYRVLLVLSVLSGKLRRR